MKIGVGLATLAAVIVALALAALHLPARSGASAARGWGACAGDRWFVRTLQDRPKLLPARLTTVAKLNKLVRPSRVPATRHPSERQIVTLKTGALLRARATNGDLVLWLLPLGNGNPKVKYVLATAPAPACNSRATGYRRKQMGAARSKMPWAPCGTAQVTGVIFFSKGPRTPGETLNRVQLSPVLGFEPQCG